jgi:tetratricopeptide (TPR) repeat protein
VLPVGKAILVALTGVLFTHTASGKSGAELLAEALREEKAARAGASLFSGPPDYRKIITAYSEALGTGALSKHDEIRALLNRAGLYAELDECPRAIPDLDKAVHLGHRGARAYALRGVCHAKVKSYDAAIKDLDQAVSVAPGDAVLKRERGRLLVEMKDFKRATADFTGAIRLLRPGESADLHILRGDTYQQQGEHQRAIDDYLAAIRLTKKHARELAVPEAGADMTLLKSLYAKIGDSYHALARTPQPGSGKR